MKRIIGYLWPYRVRMAVGFLIKVLGTVAELLIPAVLTHILDNVITRRDVGDIVLFGGVMALCALTAGVCNVVANRMAAKVTMTFARSMRHDLFEKTLLLSARATDRFTIPSLESRLTSDTYHVQNFVGMMQRMGVRAPILLLGGTVVTFLLDPALALVMLCTLPLIFLTVYGASRKGVPLYTDVGKATDDMVRVVREDVQGVRVIKALSKNTYENDRYDAVNGELCRKERKAGWVMNIVNPVMTLLMNLGIATVVAVAAYRVSDGSSSAATVIAFMQYFTLISMSVMALSRMFVMYSKCAASARRIAEVMNEPEELTVLPDDGKGDTALHVSFDNVRFSYLGKKNNLDSLTVSLRRGGSLGIIGATGSGKSTFVKLLLRFYDVDSGVIRINGRDIRSFTRKELSAMIGVALQNDVIFADTVSENIRFGRDLSDEAVERAAKIAMAHEFITADPDGYDRSLASKGTNLSGGQRQRLLIARAVAASPDILILDDSSSALDYKTDAALRKALREQMGDTTVVTVAQRVSAVKDCDVILVLEDGCVIGQGTHEELLAGCDVYREISESQMGGVLDE